MARKLSKTQNKPLAADAPVRPPAAAYPLDNTVQNRERAGLSATVAPATQAVQPRAKPTPPEQPPKLLRPLAAVLPKASLPESPKPPEKPAAVTAALRPTATQTVNATFALLEPDAKQVAVVGDFNGWKPGATPMERHDGGHWETTIALAPGRYEYKFLVDGHWTPDPLANENVWNQHGSLNSVVEVQA
jgi:hypothetical protein